MNWPRHNFYLLLKGLLAISFQDSKIALLGENTGEIVQKDQSRYYDPLEVPMRVDKVQRFPTIQILRHPTLMLL